MDFKEIGIKDKQLFDRYFKAYNPVISEMTFTNLFMWRKLNNFKYAEIDGMLCIIACPNEQLPYAFIPVGRDDDEAFKSAILHMTDYFRQNGWRIMFKKVTSDQLEVVGKIPDVTADIVEDRSNSDYVYYAKDLISLKGKKFDGKRNHISRFKKEHIFEYVAVTGELTGECRRVTEEWCAAKKCREQKSVYNEMIAINELLDNYGILSCRGALIKVDGRFEGFTIGERLNSDTAVIHIEKADSSINGLYALINQQFCEHQWNDMIFINREQDLGIEGLRKAKLSYNPVKIIDKYSMFLIENKNKIG